MKTILELKRPKEAFYIPILHFRAFIKKMSTPKFTTHGSKFKNNEVIRNASV